MTTLVKMNKPKGEKGTVMVQPSKVEYLESRGFTKAKKKSKVNKTAGGAGDDSRAK